MVLSIRKIQGIEQFLNTFIFYTVKSIEYETVPMYWQNIENEIIRIRSIRRMELILLAECRYALEYKYLGEFESTVC